jgi:dipeptidyl aminopeptidase/acylaminoacyl peptidase
VSAAALLLLLLGAAAPARGAEPRPISEFDLFRFVWLADPQISPDGKQVAFVRVDINKKKDGYDTSLWLVQTSGGDTPRRLTAGARDQAPRWSPDGSQIAFVRVAEEDGKPQPAQVFLLPMTGGEPRQLTKLPKGAGAPVWSPDGTRLAFTSVTAPKDFDKPEKAPEKVGENADAAAEQKARTSDVRVITRPAYRANGGGYPDPTRKTSIWVLSLASSAAAPGSGSGSASQQDAKPVRVTKGDFSVGAPTWSPDGKELFFTSNRTEEPWYKPGDTDLYRISADAKEADATVAVSIDGVIGDIDLTADGKSVVFEGTLTTPVRSYTQPDLFVSPLGGGAPRNLTAGFDYDVSAGLSGDQHPPRGSLPGGPVWTDARHVVIVAAKEGRANLFKVDVESGAVAPFTNGNQDIMAFTASKDASRIVTLVSTPTSVGDLFLVDASTGAQTRLTDVNKTLMSELKLTEPEEIWYQSFDGKKIQAWVQRPPDFDASKKYPLILNIHGGPHAAYGYTFVHEMQWMAAKGYVVLYPNPRGSTTYGQDFGNVIQYHYPGDDYKDLMAGVDEVIKKGYVDATRLGVTGGSGGGLLTNWVVTQTDRFAAAVSQRSIADWAGFWYTADFTLFTPSWFRAAPWEDPKDFAARSPLTFVAKIKTPMMFIEGEQDFRTPPSDGGEQLFRALKYMKRPTVMVQFPGETHELSRSGQPWHRVERLQHIVRWFDKYLQKQVVDTY